MTKGAPERPNWHLGHLDALRGIAVVGVVLVHSQAQCALPPSWHELSNNGQRGVQLFFIVSAFTLFLSNDQRRRAEKHPLRNFFIRRFCRLTPMFYFALLLTALLMPQAFGGWHNVALALVYAHWISPNAILHVNPGGWTMSLEATFYCILPLLFRYIRNLRQALWSLLVASVACSRLSMILAHHGNFHFDYWEYFRFLWFPIQFPVFLMGIVAYFFWKDWILPRRFGSSQGARSSSMLFLAASAAVLFFSLPRSNDTLYISSVAFALLLVALLLHPWRLFVNRVTIFLGKISYSIYLLHEFLLEPLVRLSAKNPFLLTHARARFVFQFSSTLLLATAAGTVTWLLFEETGIRLGRRWIARLEHRATERARVQLPAPAVALATEANTPDAQF